MGQEVESVGTAARGGLLVTYARGRQTIYKGITMRSRLEASFAAWLDGQEWSWVYEPQCFADSTGQYLPDFAMNEGSKAYYFEIKPPTADTSAALLKMHVIRSSEPTAALTVVVPTGTYPNQKWATAGSCDPDHPCAHCLGTPFRDARTIPNADRTVAGWKKCSQEETDAFLADRPWP